MKSQSISLKTTKNLLQNVIEELESYFTLKYKNLIDKNSPSILEKIENLFKTGLNPLTVIDNEPSLLLTRFMSSEELTDLAFKYINEADINVLSNETKNNILSDLAEHANYKGMDQFFKCGFRLTFGQTDTESIECEFAKQGNLEFFQMLRHYQPEYNLNMSYESTEYSIDYTLTDLIDECLRYEDKNTKYRKVLENLRIFINTNILYEKLQNDIENKPLKKAKLKI